MAETVVDVGLRVEAARLCDRHLVAPGFGEGVEPIVEARDEVAPNEDLQIGATEHVRGAAARGRRRVLAPTAARFEQLGCEGAGCQTARAPQDLPPGKVLNFYIHR